MLDRCTLWLATGDLGMVYLVVCWIAAACAILEIQKIARREMMCRVRTFYRHTVRVFLALLAAFLVWLPSQHRLAPPDLHDVMFAGLIAVVLLARAASGCKWAREKGR